MFGIRRAIQAMLDAQRDLASLLQTQSNLHRDQVIRTAQQLDAMQHVLDTLILTHPQPKMLLYMWQQRLPDVVDALAGEWSDETVEEARETAQAWQGVVRRYNQIMEQLAACSQNDD